MSKRNFRYEIRFLTPLSAQVSNFMNRLDFSGRFGMQIEVITFSHSGDKTPLELQELIKEGYETAGGEVLAITGGEIIYAPTQDTKGGADGK